MDGARIKSGMTEEATNFYTENGFLIVEDALSPAEVDALRDETTKICRGELSTDIGNYTMPEIGLSDYDVLRQFLCIHFPHKISSTMYEQLAHPAIVDVLTHVIGPDVKCMQSMLFIKPSGKPGQAWHQDEDFIPTRDRSLTGAWIALDDATVDNGCLWVIPGSHKRGILWPQHIQEDSRFDCTMESHGFPYTDEDAIPVEVKAGSIVFFNGYLLHRSLPNHSDGKYRRALVNHYMNANSLLPWHHPAPNVGMAIADFRDIVVVAGNDPYAYKGTQDISKAHVRSSGEGGCDNGLNINKVKTWQGAVIEHDHS